MYLRDGTLAVIVAVVVAALVKHGVEQRSADKGLVDPDAAPIGEDPATDGESNDCSGKNGPDADRRAPEAVAGPQDPPDHQADRDSVEDHGVRDGCVLGHQRHTLQKSVYHEAGKAGQESKIVGVARERAGDPFDEIRCAHPQKEDQNCEDPMVWPGMEQHLPEDDRRHGNVHESVEEAHGAASAVQPPVQERAHDRGGERTGKLKHEDCLYRIPVQSPVLKIGSTRLAPLGGAGSDEASDIVILIDAALRRVFHMVMATGVVLVMVIGHGFTLHHLSRTSYRYSKSKPGAAPVAYFPDGSEVLVPNC